MIDRGSAQLELRVVPPERQAETLGVLLARGDSRRADAPTVQGLLRYCRECGIEIDLYQVGDGAEAVGVMRLPGRVGIMLLSSPADAGSEAKAAAAFRPLAARFRAEGLTYLQSLVEKEEAPRRRVLEQAGFRHVTTLEYLSRASVYPWVDPPPEGRAEWVEFRDEIRDRFESVVLATYEDTLDCPELCGRRAVADVFAAHRASGEFRPQWWQIASRDGRDVGCLLLAGVIGRSALEVAYMGVTPSARGTGVGGLLLRQALHQARVAERAEVTLVVDARNAPARRLYERFGFRAIAFREAYLQFLTDEHA